MKRSIIITVWLAILLAIGGCTRTKTPDETAIQLSDTIMEAVVNKDTAALKEIFCRHIKETHDLDSEIADFLDLIDGEIISYDTPGGGVRAKSTTPKGRTEKLSLSGHIWNVKTNSGRTYQIGFNSYHIYEEDKNYIGVYYIIIQDVDTYDEKTGYPAEGVLMIGEDI